MGDVDDVDGVWSRCEGEKEGMLVITRTRTKDKEEVLPWQGQGRQRGEKPWRICVWREGSEWKKMRRERRKKREEKKEKRKDRKKRRIKKKASGGDRDTCDRM